MKMAEKVNQRLITDKSEMSVGYYLSDIKNSKPLTRDEERKLSNKIQKGDTDALHKLVEANLKYVVTEAKKYQTGSIPFSELLQQANIGAIVAAKRFDPNMGNKFITYLRAWVKQSILQYISEHGRALRLPTNQVALKGKIKKYKQIYYQHHGVEPDSYKIAEHLEVDLDKIDFLESRLKSITSIDDSIAEGSESSLHDVIADENSPSPIKNMMEESLSIDINRVLNTLGTREREIVKMVNGIDYPIHDLDEIAEIYGLTRERIRQIKEKALKKMKRLIIKNNIYTTDY